jgi:hypothetical protein
MGKLALNWSTYVSQINSTYDGTQNTDTAFKGVAEAYMVDRDLGLNIIGSSKVQSIYNNCWKFSVTWLRNIPALDPTSQQGHLSAMWGIQETPLLFYYLSKHYGLTLATDYPTAVELLQNYPIQDANYYGTNAPTFYGRVDANGNGLAGYYANNQGIGFVSRMLELSLLDGTVDQTITRFGMTVAQFAKNYVDQWKNRFTSSTAYYNDGYTGGENTYPFTYWCLSSTAIMKILYNLWKIGVITDSDLSTYLSWVNTVWRSYVLSLDGSGMTSKNTCTFLMMELWYCNLVESSTLSAPVNQTIDNLVSLFNAGGTGEWVYERQMDNLYFGNEGFGVKIKRPKVVHVNDTIYVDAWAGTVTLSADGLTLSKSSFGANDSCTVTGVQKANWRIIKS